MGMGIREYYDMLYPDLLLKMEGFSDRLKREEYLLRKVGFSAYIGAHLDPKKMAKSEDKYWPMDKGDGNPKEKMVTDEKRRRIRAMIQKERERNGNKQ